MLLAGRLRRSPQAGDRSQRLSTGQLRGRGGGLGCPASRGPLYSGGEGAAAWDGEL